MATIAEDAALMREFLEFMDGDCANDALFVSAPDPAFGDRLRRRLWRNFVVAHLRNGDETH